MVASFTKRDRESSTAKPVLLIRADANIRIGTGHMMRCLALAQAWQNAGGCAVFCTAQCTPTLSVRLHAENVVLAEIVTSQVGGEDETQTRDVAKRFGSQWIVVDGPHFPLQFGRELRRSGIHVLRIDDGGMQERCEADLIINQNADAVESMYPQQDRSTRMMLGLDFCFIRQEFLNWQHPRNEPRTCACNLLITMGGSDPDDVTGLAIRALESVRVDGLQATILAGSSNPRQRELQRLIDDMPSKPDFQETASNMPALMANSDMALIAAGGTLWELMYMGCPVLSFGRDAVQRRILDWLEERDIIVNLGDPQKCVPAEIASAVERLASDSNLRSRMSASGRQLVDGRGPSRVCDALANWA